MARNWWQKHCDATVSGQFPAPCDNYSGISRLCAQRCRAAMSAAQYLEAGTVDLPAY
jgi:hypothetical protein